MNSNGGASLLLENADAGGREIQPDNFGGEQAEIFTATRTVFHDLIGVLHPAATRFKDAADFFGKFVRFGFREIQQRQAGDDRADGFDLL